MGFTVKTGIFQGPIDLLLFLIRRHELELTEISLGTIAKQYVEYLDILREIEIDRVGDFIEVASLLVEMKSRAVLPRNEFEEEEPRDDPREDLVQRLLLYKRFKDAAVMLEDRGRRWRNRYGRIADDLPPRRTDFSDQPIQDVELWDLVSAFGRVLRDNLPKPQENIVYDETPIHVYMQRIHQRLLDERQLRFSSLFEPGMHKSALIGIFLAVLELARHHGVETRQNDLHTEIEIVQSSRFNPDASFIGAETELQKPVIPGDPASLVE